MNEFQKCENKGRELLKSFLDQIGATDQQPTEGDFDPVDYYFTYKGKKAVVEIKVRDEKYKNYSTHMIEEGKLNSLLKAKEDKACDVAYYVCFFGESVYWYTTTEILANTTIENCYCNSSTADNRGKRDKQVRMIPTSIAKIYERNAGIWATI